MQLFSPSRAGAALRRFGKNAAGNVTIEMAFASLALFPMMLGILESGRALWLQNALSFSVAEAARCASINPGVCGTAAQIQSYARNESGYGFDASVFTVAQPSCGNQVSATYPMNLNIPFMPVSVTLTAQACYPS